MFIPFIDTIQFKPEGFKHAVLFCGTQQNNFVTNIFCKLVNFSLTPDHSSDSWSS